MTSIIANRFIEFTNNVHGEFNQENQEREIAEFIREFSDDPEMKKYEVSLKFLQGESALKLKKYETAYSIFKDLYELRPPSLDVVLVKKMSEILFLTDRHEEGIALLEGFICRPDADHKLIVYEWYVNNVDDSDNRLKNTKQK